MSLAEVICSLPLNIQKGMVSVNKMESADDDLIAHEKVPTIPEDIFQEI
jgi:hypothetical protein